MKVISIVETKTMFYGEVGKMLDEGWFTVGTQFKLGYNELMMEQILGCLMMKAPEEKVESLADYQHQIWAHWMKYQLSICELNKDGSVTIPKENVERWQRQMLTEYDDLTEKEKQSDRNQVNKFIHLLY